MGQVKMAAEDEDTVRIMTIHKSKGLEFPMVLLCGFCRKLNYTSIGKSAAIHKDFGIGLPLVNYRESWFKTTLLQNAVRQRFHREEKKKKKRVLYVAMTRAKEKLILTARIPDVEKFREKMEQNREFQREEQQDEVAFSVLAGASCYLDFVVPGLMHCTNQIQLISQEEILTKDIKDAALEIDRKQRLLLKAKAMKEVTGQDNEFMTILSEKFGRTYPYQYLSNLFVKTTVSELKKRAMHGLPEQSTVENEAFTRALFEEPEVVPYIPSFISSKEGMSGTDRGSAYHKVMELLDFAAIRESITENDMEKEINGQLDSFVMEGRLSSQWRESVSVSKIVRFLESDLAKRMAQSASKGLLRREQPFVLGLRASRLGGEFPDSEQVLIQGIIDVFFEEEGKIVVADYKTDAVKTSEELVKRYQVQLDYYSEALMRLTGKEVTEKIIYSFALGREIMLY